VRPAAAIVALLLLVGPAWGEFQEISLPEALAQAKRQKRIVIVDFYTTW